MAIILVAGVFADSADDTRNLLEWHIEDTQEERKRLDTQLATQNERFDEVHGHIDASDAEILLYVEQRTNPLWSNMLVIFAIALQGVVGLLLIIKLTRKKRVHSKMTELGVLAVGAEEAAKIIKRKMKGKPLDDTVLGLPDEEADGGKQ